MEKKDGGPAFPYSIETEHAPSGAPVKATVYSGMSLRDWFAGQALASMMRDFGKLTDSYEQIAGHAYCVADAMLAERSKDA